MPKPNELSVSSSGPTVHLEFLDEGIIAVLTLDDFKAAIAASVLAALGSLLRLFVR